MIDFTQSQLERYSRHILLDNVGVEGQQKLLNSKVMIIGAGGLGAPAAMYCAAAGIGRIGIVDADVVEVSNLQRQIIHFTADVGSSKVSSAKEKMEAINPDVEVESIKTFVNASNIEEIIDGYDFVIDGTDSFATKFLINDACIMKGIPFSHGGILRFNGQTMTVLPKQSACYRCVFHKPPPKNMIPTCSEAGVLGAVAGMLGTIQAAEALKFITGAGDILADALMTFDALPMNFRKVVLRRNPKCAVCSENPSITELRDEEQQVCDLR
ncbi:molybdopterin-synthase adenylyltransferase MoeB [Prosthecochloris sp. SCSIO W1101]|uniref:HesA/MoeB/ThiF family protein n=1 Tax=Prosthecochloris sp. SCSIO W1101 TaxID=2992242 RepID=UPI00223E3F60|nr:molybdopterin-synthase adenylyltransferase MoeB [Prosthecochloris sp. SCSIO W1101]UZJ40641.1 molybdopterin-synthase adenylyltransferase MoeB [Prosthecochloris sp. SCSIO W1101]